MNWLYNLRNGALTVRCDEWPRERGMGDRSAGTQEIVISAPRGEEIGELMQSHCTFYCFIFY